MAKKKSKTQKSKKNAKKKLNTTKVTKTEVKTTTKKTKTPQEVKQEKPIVKEKSVSKKIVDKDKVKYNVLFTEKALSKINNKEKNTKSITKFDKIKQKLSSITKIIITFIINCFNKLKKAIKTTYNKIKNIIKSKSIKRINKKPKKVKKVEQKKIVKKKDNKKEEPKPKNIILRILYEIKNNLHIAFNVALIITYVFLLTGLIRTEAFTSGTIIYVSCIIIFLMIVAISYNKYLSGKVYSLLIIAGMSFAIYQMQYTYDFINNLNSNKYEYKEYYVVTFNNGRNKSIYNINNKKVGLLKDNSTNIERILNIKLDKVQYIEYEDPNALYSDFYSQEYRAIIVNENQYKYMTNHIEENSRNVKILYKFKANGKK